MDEALWCLGQEGLASLQIIFNIFRQKPAAVLFDRARQAGVALIVRLPLASGLLSGKFTADTAFVANDHRTYNREASIAELREIYLLMGSFFDSERNRPEVATFQTDEMEDE